MAWGASPCSQMPPTPSITQMYSPIISPEPPKQTQRWQAAAHLNLSSRGGAPPSPACAASHCRISRHARSFTALWMATTAGGKEGKGQAEGRVSAAAVAVSPTRRGGGREGLCSSSGHKPLPTLDRVCSSEGAQPLQSPFACTIFQAR